MAFTEQPPPPLPPNVKRFNADGTPTQAQVEYETRLRQWQKRLAAAIP
jgi:hypothetical protein